MLARSVPGAQEDAAAPEILIIKDILLRDLRCAHEARMDALQKQLTNLQKECTAGFSALQQRIDSLATESERSQKQALAELGDAISEIANRFRLEQGAKDVG